MMKEINKAKFLLGVEAGRIEWIGTIGNTVYGRTPYVKVVGEVRPRQFRVVKAVV